LRLEPKFLSLGFSRVGDWAKANEIEQAKLKAIARTKLAAKTGILSYIVESRTFASYPF
jgi:hypothetical protein